jgi:lysophospholipase L1-like esterase
MKYWTRMEAANQMLEDLCKKHEKVFFIDISTPMFIKTGVLKNDIYADDRLHLNEKGYALLKKAIIESVHKLSN